MPQAPSPPPHFTEAQAPYLQPTDEGAEDEVLDAELVDDESDLEWATDELDTDSADIPEATEVYPATDFASDQEAAEAARERSGSRRDRIKRSAGRRPRRKSRESSVASDGWVSARPPEPADPVSGATALTGEVGPTDAVVRKATPEEIREETFAVAIRRLTPSSASTVSTAISLAEGHLADDETVKVGVVGRARGWPALVLLTDRRILLVVERERPMVSSLHPGATELTLHDRFQPSEMHILDRGRELVIDGIVDTHLAREMCEAESVRS
jgi:hypothetical protein